MNGPDLGDVEENLPWRQVLVLSETLQLCSQIEHVLQEMGSLRVCHMYRSEFQLEEKVEPARSSHFVSFQLIFSSQAQTRANAVYSCCREQDIYYTKVLGTNRPKKGCYRAHVNEKSSNKRMTGASTALNVIVSNTGVSRRQVHEKHNHWQETTSFNWFSAIIARILVRIEGGGILPTSLSLAFLPHPTDPICSRHEKPNRLQGTLWRKEFDLTVVLVWIRKNSFRQQFSPSPTGTNAVELKTPPKSVIYLALCVARLSVHVWRVNCGALLIKRSVDGRYKSELKPLA